MKILGIVFGEKDPEAVDYKTLDQRLERVHNRIDSCSGISEGSQRTILGLEREVSDLRARICRLEDRMLRTSDHQPPH